MASTRAGIFTLLGRLDSERHVSSSHFEDLQKEDTSRPSPFLSPRGLLEKGLIHLFGIGRLQPAPFPLRVCLDDLFFPGVPPQIYLSPDLEANRSCGSLGVNRGPPDFCEIPGNSAAQRDIRVLREWPVCWIKSFLAFRSSPSP